MIITTTCFKGFFRPLCLLLILVSSGCSKKNKPSPESPVEGGEKPQASVNILPIKLEQGQLQISFSYLRNSNLIASIIQSDGTTEKFTYTDKDVLKSYERYRKEELIYLVEYTVDPTGKSIHGAQHLIEAKGKVSSPLGYYDIRLNADNKVADVKWYNLNDKLQKTLLFNYSESGSISTMVNTSPDVKPVSFIYDDKNGIFKNTLSCQFLLLENSQTLLYCLKANVIQQSGMTGPIQFSYTYNKDGYPTTILSKDENGLLTSWKVSY